MTANPAIKPHRKKAPRRDQILDLRQVLGGLVSDGIITAEQAQRLVSRPQLPSVRKEHPLETVARQEWHSAIEPHEVLDLERLTRWLAAKSGLPYLRIDPLKMDLSAIAGVVSHPYAQRFHILPLSRDSEKLLVATAQPFLREWEEEISRLQRVTIERVVANPVEIRRLLTEFYKVGRAISKASITPERSVVSGVLNLEQLVDLARSDKLDANDSHIVNIVDWLLQYAFGQRASDIHLEPRRGRGRIRFRIDGVLHLVQEIPAVVMTAVTSRLKSLGRMDLVERRRPQDGRLKTKTPAGREVELRLSTMPTAFGEKLVLRIFDPEVLNRDFSGLGFSDRDSERWEWMLNKPHGIILLTGPTGSGKTTTLYSALRLLAQPEVNVCTIEDPIEMVEPSFNQMQVQANIGVDFAGGVRNLLRQDPDIIMIGEVRDLATAEMAIQASLTGHLVLSTLHTNDAVSAVTRLLELGVAPYLIRDTLVGVVAQRLLRTLCPHCKKQIAPEEVKWGDLAPPAELDEPPVYFAPVGCDECRQTGYRGRVGIYEIAPITKELRELIAAGVDVAVLRDEAMREGMRVLRMSAAEKVAMGLTTVDEVRRVVPVTGDAR
jgi:general secretion pathway protein E